LPIVIAEAEVPAFVAEGRREDRLILDTLNR
jgi:hypothetical protein